MLLKAKLSVLTGGIITNGAMYFGQSQILTQSYFRLMFITRGRASKIGTSVVHGRY